MLPSTVRAGLTAGLALWLVALPASAQEKAKSTQREEPPPAAVLPAGTRIPLVLENTINTKNARVGDRLYFQTIYPVVVNNRILIPAGSYVRGSVTFTKRPGRIKGRGELHVRFEELTLPNGYTVDLQASLAGVGTTGNEEVNREEGGIKGEGSKGEDVRTVATTTSAGAGIGAIAGRGKGVAIGAGVGAAAGLAAILLTRGRELVLPRGTTVEIALDRPLELDPALVQFDWTGQGTAPSGPTPRLRQRNPLRPRIPF
ncbi:MAG: TrbI/VirB10 family protein [Candidatus Acidiferrales bacterium]|nr:TrbI/VirB10 family protein [Acidobacteriota bacterium]